MENRLAKFYQQTFAELYSVSTLISMTKNSCKEREFKSEYYGMPPEKITALSNERNDYINMLEIISDKISYIMDIYLEVENEKQLQENTNYCSRKITA